MITHHFVMTSSLLIKILKIDKFGDFSCDIDSNSRTDDLEMLSPLYLTNVTQGDRKEPQADTKCPPAAQRKQAKRACIYIYININRVLIVMIIREDTALKTSVLLL